MIALEILTVLILLGLAAVMLIQHYGNRRDRGHKGDAVKSPEEIKTHQSRH